MMIDVKETQDVAPLCPHCTEPVKEIWCRELSGFFGKRYVYFCSLCRKVIGLTHRKGFWMG